MHHSEFNLVTTDGLTLFGQSWLPEDALRGIICVVHGLGDHSGRFKVFADFLCPHNIGVSAFDLRGHGKSEGRRGHTKDYKSLQSDIEQFLIATRLEYQDEPIILFGHSLGATLVTNFLLNHKSKEVAGAILTAPWFKLTNPPSKTITALARILNILFPAMQFTEITEPQDLTSDPNESDNFRNDPLVHDKISIRMYIEGQDSADRAMKMAHLLPCPTLIQHGNKDPLTSWESSAEFAHLAGSNVEFKLWEGMRHEPHHETERIKFFEFQIEWILGLLNRRVI